jgi:hypothetical protein
LDEKGNDLEEVLNGEDEEDEGYGEGDDVNEDGVRNKKKK